jgi:hypothetical protein
VSWTSVYLQYTVLYWKDRFCFLTTRCNRCEALLLPGHIKQSQEMLLQFLISGPTDQPESSQGEEKVLITPTRHLALTFVAPTKRNYFLADRTCDASQYRHLALTLPCEKRQFVKSKICAVIWFSPSLRVQSPSPRRYILYVKIRNSLSLLIKYLRIFILTLS